ncbi:hypothetical protein C8K11_11117 [Novosphingobium sp. GV055]|nr:MULTISPECIES: hypothetical protein [unclassified Novosphingobium]PTR08575.1 hypothetical protein C8K11_11117 [Novosphingobium sp. GV055]PUB01298.1 hypothetical protein C8K12_11117 [Novosphingobium sp. GV061]PUB16872.1 hypothetical protein C8K14_11117 [Novosphingobium sp. GV079]PUB39895.1 hypothetical protein C8K10_11117 [Novosphingobium sp. GV027]
MSLLDAAIPVLLTALVGTRIAYKFQDRAAKENRFFEASRSMYTDMISAANKITTLSGKRIYAAQRLSLMSSSDESYNEAKFQLKSANLEWNNNLLEMDMAVRSLFENSKQKDFEDLQNKMAHYIRILNNKNSTFDKRQNQIMIKNLQLIRSEYFCFIREMYREASKLHRQMHFGVSLEYNLMYLENMSTGTLINLLFKSSVEHKRVICSPTNFGMPVSAEEARLGIHE